MDWNLYLKDAQDAYAETGLWSESCKGTATHADCCGDECDSSLKWLNYNPTNIGRESRAQMDSEVKAWFDTVMEEIPHAFVWWDAGQFGHDFWLTRNGHGAGYWDRFYGDSNPGSQIGRWLTDNCKPYGECSLFVDPDDDVQYEG